jgi:hypothetical protein
MGGQIVYREINPFWNPSGVPHTYYGDYPVLQGYAMVAKTKKQCEYCLRKNEPDRDICEYCLGNLNE